MWRSGQSIIMHYSFVTNKRWGNEEEGTNMNSKQLNGNELYASVTAMKFMFSSFASHRWAYWDIINHHQHDFIAFYGGHSNGNKSYYWRTKAK